MRLLVLDGNSLVNRAFFGIKLLTTRDGRYTNAVYGFMNILQSLLKEVEPDEVAVAFDLKAPTFRHQMYSEYKAGRHGMPEELKNQMPVVKELLGALGYRIVSREGWEADDILGTLAAACTERGDECFLATGDRDSLQLVSPSVTVLLASTVMGKSQTKRMDVAAIREQYGVEPRQLIEVKSLMGDSSDNIPGVKGIGEKTALGLVQRFGSLEAVYANLEDPFIKPKQRENLINCKEAAELSHVLGTIRLDAPIETAPGAYRVEAGDKARAAAIFEDLEMHAMVVKLGLADLAPAGLSAGIKDTEEKPLPRVQTGLLPEKPKGSWILAEKAARTEKQGAKYVELEPACWYAVQGETVCGLTEMELVRLLDDPAVKLEVFDSAPLYALAMSSGGMGNSIVWDAKLAAYLLDASASKYEAESMCGAYQAKQAFLCEEWPIAGQLAGLFAKLKEELKAQEQEALYREIEFPLAQVLADMTRIGVLVDRQGILDYGAELNEALESTKKKLFEAAGCEFNPNSPKQLGELLFETLGLPHGKKTKTGWATDKATLDKLRDQSPVVELLLEYRSYQKLSSTYVEGLLKAIGEDGRIHSRFNQTEARTGRLSSDEPNLQNIPIRTELGSRLRAYFIAGEGRTLLDADYSQIELRILAHVTGDQNMQEAFLKGQDIHRSTAARIYGVPTEEITARQRSSAKTINFGIMYGKGAFSLSQDLKISLSEADQFLKTYLAAFPTVDAYMNGVIADAREKGYTTTLFGRRRALPELANSNFQIRSAGERMARNTPIQGTAADIIKLAMVRVWRRLKKEGLKSRLILTVHDELIVEAEENEIPAASRILQEEMEGCVTYSVPLTAEVQQGKNWLEAH